MGRRCAATVPGKALWAEWQKSAEGLRDALGGIS
jgi:hypothetical protein